MGGLGRAASEVGANDAPVDFPPMLFVFEVDGKQEFPKPAPAPTPRRQEPAPEQANNSPAQGR